MRLRTRGLPLALCVLIGPARRGRAAAVESPKDRRGGIVICFWAARPGWRHEVGAGPAHAERENTTPQAGARCQAKTGQGGNPSVSGGRRYCL